MTTEQSNEEKLLKSDSTNKDGAEGISSSVEDDNHLEKSLASRRQEPDDDSDDSSINDFLPPEILEALPDRTRRQISSSLSLSMAMPGGSLHSSPIAKKIDANHTALWITVRDSRILSLPYLPFPSCPRWMSKTLYYSNY